MQTENSVKAQIAKEVRKNLLFPGRYFIVYNHKNEKNLSKGAIVDIETTGLNPKLDRIITLGILKSKQIRILQLIKPEYTRFQNLCHHTAEQQPKPRYAYAAHFEQDFLQVPDGWQDLTQYFEIDYDWENPLRRYSLANCTFHPFPSEPFDIDGSQVPQAWQLWLKTKDAKFLTDIIYHPLCDLLRTQELIEKSTF